MGLELSRNQTSPIGQNNNAPAINFERSAQNITQELRKQMQDVGNYATERIDDCISGWQHEVAVHKIKSTWLRNSLKAGSEEKNNFKNLKQQADKEIKELKRLKNTIKNRETSLNKKKENNTLKIHKLSGKILFDARQVTKKEGVFEAVPKGSRDLDFKLGDNLDDKDDFFVAYSIFPDSWDLDQDPNLKPSLETSLAKASSSIEELEQIYEERIESTKEKIQLFNDAISLDIDAISLDIKKLEKKHNLSNFSDPKNRIRNSKCKAAESKKTLLQLLKFCQRVTSLREKIQGLNGRIQQIERETYIVRNTNSGSFDGFAPLQVCAEVEAKLEKISAMYNKAKTKIKS